MKISIIIPTLNEEKNLERLLSNIRKQNFNDYEIIVSDADSTDNTIEIAKKYNAKVVKGGNPAQGRNNGAKASSGEFLYFFDADVLIPKNFLKKTYNEMQKRYLDLATCEIRPISNLTIDKVLHNLVNMYIKLNQYSDPHAPGFCILVTKRLFFRVNGFDEKLKLCEDHDFVKRASKLSNFRVLDSSHIRVSVRRLKKEGRFNLAKKYMLVELYRMFNKRVDKNIVKYEFANFRVKNKSSFETELNKIDMELKKFSLNYKRFINGILENTDDDKKMFEKIKENMKNFFYKEIEVEKKPNNKIKKIKYKKDQNINKKSKRKSKKIFNFIILK
jgi:glycosyltransferase involved in cell wall biosynthesis